MIIQKLDIKSTSNPNSRRLNKSNSTPSVFPINNTNNDLKLPYLLSDPKFKSDSIQLSYLNEYDMRNFLNNNDKSPDLMVKYKPRRFLAYKQKRNKNSANTFMDLRNMPLNENKVFKSIMSNRDNNIFTTNLVQTTDRKSYESLNNDIFKLKNFSFRYNILLKIEENIKEFNSLKKNSNLISQIKINNHDEIINKLTKIMQSQKNIFDRGLSKLELNKENSKDYENFIKKDVMTFCDYNNLMNKLIELLYDEINLGKDNNFKLLQRNHEEELIINAKNKSLNELNSYINRYDVDTKINYVKNQEKKRKHIKELYISKKNEYIYKIYQLENEIKLMANILNKNKIYFDKCKEFEEKVYLSKKELDRMKTFFRREIREKNYLYEEEITKKEELKEELLNIKKVVDNLKKEKKYNKNLDILAKEKIKKLEEIINEKNENIMMMNEELESFLRENYQLKKKIKDKEFIIVTLEMKIKKDKEKENILNNLNNSNGN